MFFCDGKQQPWCLPEQGLHAQQRATSPLKRYASPWQLLQCLIWKDYMFAWIISYFTRSRAKIPRVWSPEISSGDQAFFSLRI
jgi:hypothetical protein